ncbi:hypothetical protein FUAX_26770 [Fulvitalea axinellae]|uniref:WG repeat-containing protein n=1 Tax=Fulvitalea axinellae TaxID=1182444 RepID=A0AAU9DCU8_9BACT|nr:hypothetical protein FUAX_26770 [Fulvitalea axinellae]
MTTKTKFIFVFVPLLSLIFSVASADNTKKSLRMLEKGEWRKVWELSHKDLQKDSSNVGAHYALSLLFSENKFEDYNLDSSYYEIIEAINFYSLYAEDSKERERLGKIDVDSLVLDNQRKRVDSLAFESAKESDGLEDYKKFIGQHKGAIELPLAIARRNEIAFENATKSNTFLSYRRFLQEYPDADQATEAKRRYDRLLFETKTKSGKLSSYKSFLENHPSTPYRSVVEAEIFKVMVAGNNQASVEAFIKEYGLKSPVIKVAESYLYHIYREEHKGAKGFLSAYWNIPGVDSLKNVIAVDTIPYLLGRYEESDNKYWFAKPNGTPLWEKRFAGIQHRYLCDGFTDDFVMVSEGGKSHLLGRNGKEFYSGNFESATPLGYGLVSVQADSGIGAVHECGWDIVEPEYEYVGVIGKGFLLVGRDEKFGLFSATGKKLLKVEYDEIAVNGDFVLLRQQDMVAVLPLSKVIKAADKHPVNPRFVYEDAEVIGGKYVVGYQGDNENLSDSAGATLISSKDQEIFKISEYWATKSADGYRLYNSKGQPLGDSVFEDLKMNKRWLALRKGGKWATLGLGREGQLSDYRYTDVNFLSDDISLFYAADSVWAAFSDVAVKNFAGKYTFRLVKSADESVPTEYLQVKNAKKYVKVYNEFGKEILSGYYNNIDPLGPDYLIYRQKKMGLLRKDGKRLLKNVYDGIGHYTDGYVSVLLGKRFGVFNDSLKVYIKPQYSEPIAVYGGGLLVATRGGKKAIVDKANKKLTPFEYDKIEYWTDSVALVKTGELWSFYNISQKKKEGEVFQEYSLLKDSPTEKVILTSMDARNGVVSSLHGKIVADNFDTVRNIGSEEDPLYFCEKFFSEADLYIILYYNSIGERIGRQSLTEEQFEKISCE